MTERQLGNKWAAKRREAGAFVQKLPASTISGIPDWYVADREGVGVLEAKKALDEGPLAYSPQQLTGAQIYFLRCTHLSCTRSDAMHAGVLVLAEDGYLELSWAEACRALPRASFDVRKEPYE